MSLQALKNDLEEFEPITGLDGYLSTRKSEEGRIEQARKGTIPQGLSTGYNRLDFHFRYKQGNLLIMNGHDNVGKSFVAWYLMVIASVKYGWRWIMFSSENESPDIRTQLVEFLCGKLAKYIEEKEFNHHLDFVYDHFEIIEISDEKEEVETYDFISSIAQRIIDESEKPFNGVLFDPYNALEIDMSKMDRRLSTHDYHYSCANKMRKFKKKNNVATWVNMHAVSEALRKVDKDGYPLPPGKADTEGGGKFSNKADEFITWHRYVQDSERALTTEMHVRKVKDTKTGGKCTDLKNPVVLMWECHNGFYGFYDESMNCPLAPKPEGLPKIEKLPEAPNNFDMTEAFKMIDEHEAPF
jgi:hypothetical protein